MKRRAIQSKKTPMREPLPSAKIHSRKRKRTSSVSPFTSALTRSKARIFYHQNRSGFSRPDRISKKPNAEMESLESFMGLKCRGGSRLFMAKDLRHKRVFSPDVASVPDEEIEENEERKKLLKSFDASTELDDVKEVDELQESRIVRSEAENGSGSVDGANALNLKDQEIPPNPSSPKIKMALNGCHRRKVFKTPSSFSYRRMLPHLIDIVNDDSSVSEIEIVDAVSPCKYPKLEGINLKTRSTAETRYAVKTECLKPSENPDLKKVHVKLLTVEPNLSIMDNDVEEKGRENDVNGDDALVDEHIQTTPPDAGLVAKVEDVYVGGYVDANKVPAENQCFVGLPAGREKNSNGTMKQSPNTKCGSNSTNATALNPCSRLKLFRNPRSLSYRRLLPFLMDISKNTCSSRKPQPKMPQVAAEEDRLPAPAPDTEQGNVNNLANQNLEKKSLEDLIESSTFSPALDGSSSDSNKKCVSLILDSSTMGYSSNIRPTSGSFVTPPDLGMLNGFPTEETPRTPNNPTKSELDLGSKETNTVSEQSSIVNHDILTHQCISEVPKSVEKQKMCLESMDMQLELHSGNAESINLEQHSFQLKASNALGCSQNRPFKGILKKNTRGCRGLCNCLNCASFRLHAERAFEFSRNQLHDAGEVASELMKELAKLRLLLQKSMTENNDSSSIRPHPVFIQQACNKALETETLARERLDELNDNLNAHCKTPVLLQPKVTFAYNI